MATMEKPKQKKTKTTKVKQKPNRETSNDDEENLATKSTSVLQPVLDLLDFDEFETKATPANEIVSRDCSIAGDYKKEDEELKETPRAVEDLGTIDIRQQDEIHDIVCEAPTTSAGSNAESAPPVEIIPVAPSAPQADFAASTATVEPTIDVPVPVLAKYPDLSPLHHEEKKSKVVFQKAKIQTTTLGLTGNQVQPFTAEQFKEIYHCNELELVKQFELEFLMNSLLETYEQDPLYAALQEYYNLQSKLTMNLHDIKKLRKEAIEIQEKIWIEVPITKTFAARCGDRVELKETVTYNIAQVDPKKLEAASTTLAQVYDLVCNNYTTNLFTAKVVKVKIDAIINEIISYPRVIACAQKSTLVLHGQLDAETLQCVAHIRIACTILFSFVRRVSPNASFDADLKQWLCKLVSAHLLLATREDHWFLLFNVLRCPSGVGNWAASFIQVPCDTIVGSPTGAQPREIPLPLNSPEINNCIAIIQILLLPIKKRNDYLKAFTQSHKEISDPVKEERWILIDSDGEDAQTANGECVGLKESDLIALLNQIPFEKLFISVLNIEKFLNDYIIDVDLVSASQMLKVIAFFTKLIEIFGEGMLTYNTERYKQFAKRLGRLTRHTLQYVSDYNELFIRNNLSKDPFICERIAVELNALLIKACSYIYRTRNLSTWQYFSSLPFNALHIDTVWQIFYYLNVGFPTEFPTPHEDYNELFHAPDYWTKFNVANADLSAEDLYYLLQAFFEIANERDKTKDWDLIEAVCLHMFNIGYINEPTRDICYKASRDMLLNLTLAYEDLMSSLLLQLKIRFNEIENATYLFKSLPLENWKPAMDSFEILSNWLLHYDFKLQENMLARIIISHLNWGFDCNGRLFLPHNIHVRMACLVTEALNKHVPEVIGQSGISESVRQVSNLIDFTHSTKEQFSTWCWSMASVLRLHLMDQSVESIKRTLQNPTEPLLFVPELERLDVIYQGVTENRPLALYVGIMVSLHGHSVPLICQKGFELMKQLLSDYRHAAVIRCLELIVPLFLDTPETLANCENFHFILNALLNADKTYLKMAKDMIYSNPVGPVLELLDNMIHHQITTYTDYGLSTPLNLINVWLNCLIALPNWQNTNVVYLLDKVLRVAYQFPNARTQAVEYFRNYFKDCDDWKGTSKMSSIKTFFGSNQSRIPVVSPSHGWLALVLLEIEFKTQDSHFWSEFLRQLTTTNDKSNLEAALKKTTTLFKIPSFSPHMLVLYKYANIVANMDIAHPVFPIVTQKFFELYLSRVPAHVDEPNYQHIYGVADKFFEFNIPLMKKIKTNIKAAEAYYSSEATKNASDEALCYFYRNCAKIMKSFAIWLEETGLNRLSKDEVNFPPQYNNEKLREILYGNTPHWTEFLYLPHIRKEHKYQADQWARKCFRLKTTKRLRSPLLPKPKSTAMERIKRHLSSYDKRLDAPIYKAPQPYVPRSIDSNTLKVVKEKVKVLNNTATRYHFNTCELNSINRNYLDNVLNLYKMVPYEEIKVKSCTSLVFNRNCTNPARIKTTMEHIRQDEAVQRKIQTFRERHDQLMDEIIDFKVDDFAQCVQELGGIIKALICAQTSDHNRTELVTNTGTTFFYTIIENMNDIAMKFTPTNDFYTQVLSELGIFIQDNQEKQGLAILQLTLKRPDLLKVLSGVFVPYLTRPEYCLKMYKFLIDSHLKRCDTKILFVLLSKFDLATWLETFRPKLFDINQLLHLVLNGLESWSQPESSLLQDQFRRHLVHIFNYDFPQHYGEVMQLVLDRISEQKLTPAILLDLLNSLFARFNFDAISMDMKMENFTDMSIEFARKQNLFNMKAATDTIMLFARHFQKERLQHGLHGLYPKHKDYCKPLSMWFQCFGHVLVITTICTYQELLADQICDIIFATIVELYTPWLIVYTEGTMQHLANWMRQLAENSKILYPWSEQHAKTSKIMIKSFINTLNFVLDNLPVSLKILEHTFAWYVHQYAIVKMESYILKPIHEALWSLPWRKFRPQPLHIEMFYDSLQKFIPESHALLGYIFIHINWNAWFTEVLPILPRQTHSQVVSRLFTVFIKIAFEPNIHVHTTTSRILEDAIKYPWFMVEYAELEQLYKWYVTTVEPAIILRIPGETNYADRAVLDLLQLTCAMMPERNKVQPISNASAKRILYSRSYLRSLRNCVTKNPKLLDSKDGKRAFNNSFYDLLDSMNKVLISLAETHSLEERKREALNMMIEIVLPMQTENLDASILFVGTLVHWQEECEPGNLLVNSILSAVAHMQNFIAGTYMLLEAAIASYFRTSTETKDWHVPTWQSLLQTLRVTLDKLELMPIVSGQYYFLLHIYILYKIDKMEQLGDKVTFLQDFSQIVEKLKTIPETEPCLALVWGVLISRGCQTLAQSELTKKPLLMLARHLHLLSTQSEGWGDGLLGAIGLKKDNVTIRRKVLTRCLSCVIFSLFPNSGSDSISNPNQEYLDSLQELTQLLANKKYQDIKPLIVNAINVITEERITDLRDMPHFVCRLIGMFYSCSYLTTIPEIWSFDFKLT